MKDIVRKFIGWWERAPLWKSLPLLPVVIVLYVISIIINRSNKKMATTTLENKTVKSRIDMRTLMASITAKLGDSIGDMVVTVAVTGITLAYMSRVMHPVYANIIPGLYIAGMLVQLFVRIVHRFDESYTNDEIAERLIEMENAFNERLDSIIRNQMPY